MDPVTKSVPEIFSVSAELPAGRLGGRRNRLRLRIVDGKRRQHGNDAARIRHDHVRISRDSDGARRDRCCQLRGADVRRGNIVQVEADLRSGNKTASIYGESKRRVPAVALAGIKLETVGCVLAGKIVSVTGPELPPPETPLAGFITVMLAVPPVTMSFAGIAAVICAGLT